MALAEYVDGTVEHDFEEPKGRMMLCLNNCTRCLAVVGSSPQNSFGTPFELPA